MTVSDIIQYARTLTKTTSYQFSDDELFNLVKIWLHKLQREIAQARADFFGVKSYTSPALDQEDIPLPDDCIELKAVEVCYNADKDVKEQKWYKAEEIDISQSSQTWDDIQKNATIEHPVYDVLDNRLWIAPIRQAVIGNKTVKIRLWYISRPADPINLTDAPLISDINKNLLDYQPIIALGVAYDILSSLGSPRAPEFIQRYEVDISKMLKEIKQQNLEAIIADIPYLTGDNY